MANSKMLNALNEQLKQEYYAAYMYMSMSAYFSDVGLNGFAHWMRMQMKEEILHAEKMYDYILFRNWRVTLLAIDQPPIHWENPLDVFKEGLKHEKFVTDCINSMVDLAIEMKDHATHYFLQWYVNEQVEEEESFTDIISQLKFMKEDGGGLLLLDRELGQRGIPTLDDSGSA